MPAPTPARPAIAAAVLTLALAWAASPARAATFTYAGVAFDQANSVRTASLIEGSGPASFAFSSGFDPGPGYDGNLSIGALVTGGAPAPSLSFNLGNDDSTGILELTFGPGMMLPNLAGDDLVVFENGGLFNVPGVGDIGNPDLYAIAVRVAGQSGFTGYYYKSETLGGLEEPVYSTTFDLSDLGVGAGVGIDAIRIINLDLTARILGTNPLAGFVGAGTAGTVAIGTDPSLGYLGLTTSGMGDPDITYVAGLHALVAVPEPGSLALLALGLAGLAVGGRRRVRVGG